MKKSFLNINKSVFANFSKSSSKTTKQDQNLTTNVLSWSDRNKASKLILNCEYVIIATPEKEISNEIDYSVLIYLDEKGSWVDIDFGCQMPCLDIPELSVEKWSKQNYSYFKHWLAKVFDEPGLQKTDKFILINVSDEPLNKMEEKNG
jgi:hypothetical protein